MISSFLWPALHGWCSCDRSFLRLRRSLTSGVGLTEKGPAPGYSGVPASGLMACLVLSQNCSNHFFRFSLPLPAFKWP